MIYLLLSVVAGTRQKLQNIENLDIRIDDCQIMNMKSQIFLRIIIDENLNWTSRLDYLFAAISSRISLLKQLATYEPENIVTSQA